VSHLVKISGLFLAPEIYPFTDEEQTALFKDPVLTAL